MSKAFTRESDDDADEPVPVRPAPMLPPGVSNFMTPGGAEALRAERARLMEVERLALVAAGETRKVAVLDARIAYLEMSLRTAVVVPVPVEMEDLQAVRLGATVTVRRRRGGQAKYRIVGVDEVDLDRGWVSFFSPIARALMNARIGERVRFRFPSGEEELEILGINYETE